MGVFESLLRITLGSANIAAHVVRENRTKAELECRQKRYEEELEKWTDPDLEAELRSYIEDPSPECYEWVWMQIEPMVERVRKRYEDKISSRSDIISEGPPYELEMNLILLGVKPGVRLPFHDNEGRLSNSDCAESNRLELNRFLALEALMMRRGKGTYKYEEWSLKRSNFNGGGCSLTNYLDVFFPVDG